MKHTTVALILIFLISMSILMSGCIDKESAITEIISPQSDIASSSKGDFEGLQLERNEDLLQDIERFHDPRLENLNVVINNPNIEIINLTLYESDSSWGVSILVQNNAKTPVWITTDLIGVGDKKYSHFALLDSGKRKHYSFGSKDVRFDQGIDYGIRVEIYASDTVMPKISSDFVYSYRRITYQAADYHVPLLNLKSLKYEVDDRKQRYATFEVHNPSEFTFDGAVTIHIRGQRADYYESGDNRKLFEIEPGETKDIQIPLRDYDPKDIRTIYFTSSKQEQKQSNDPYRFD